MPKGVYKRTKPRKKPKQLNCVTCGRFFYRPESQAKFPMGQFCKMTCKRHKHSEETKEKIRLNHRRIQTEETRRKISEIKKSKVNWNYKGGVVTENEQIRKSVDSKLWRIRVFERDNYRCQVCQIRGGEGKKVVLHPHHIYNFSNYTNQRFTIENGITLCSSCHRNFHKSFGFSRNNMAQINEFISNN